MKENCKVVLGVILGLLVSIGVYPQYILPDAGYNLVGYVSDGQKGIPNVVISDGFTTTVTNGEGVYQMRRNDNAKFVFISVPAEYKIPVNGSIPAHYRRIDKDMGIFYANFQLEKGQVENNFTLVAMADTQPSKDWELKRFRTETVKDINTFVATYPKSKSFVGIGLGDLTWDAPELYPGFVDALNEIPFAILPVIGNHDHDNKVKKNDRLSSHNYEKYFGPTYYSYNKGQCHFVVLDDILYDGRKDYKIGLTEEQLNWLKEDLSYVSKDKLIVVGVHAPTKYHNRLLTNSNDLYKLLAGYKTIIMSGHTHNAAYTEIDENITEYTLNAVFGSGWVGDINPRGGPNGYGVFEFEGNKLVNQFFKGTGFPSSYQMKLYRSGVSVDNVKGVVANIWNWNKYWTVEVYENGKLRGNMEKYTGYDPDAYDYMLGPDKPKHRPKTEPAKSSNLFHYEPKSKKAIVTVVAKDEFGNSYTEQIDLSVRTKK